MKRKKEEIKNLHQKKSGLHKPLFFLGYEFLLCDYPSIRTSTKITSQNIIHPTVWSSHAKLNSHIIRGIHNSTNINAHTIFQNILFKE